MGLSPLAHADGVAIEHEPVACLVADKHPRLLACFAPRPEVSRARVYFRATGTLDWYFVEMAADGPCFAGVLPKPRPSTGAVDYYLLALDRSFTEARTPEYAPVVVREEKDWRVAIDAVLAAHGRLDVLVNNAGVTGFEAVMRPHDPENADLEDWRAVPHQSRRCVLGLQARPRSSAVIASCAGA